MFQYNKICNNRMVFGREWGPADKVFARSSMVLLVRGGGGAAATGTFDSKYFMIFTM